MRQSSEPRIAIHAAANEVRPGGEALGVRIKKQNRQRDGRKLQRQRIQLPRGEHQQRRRDQSEHPGEADGKLAFGQSAIGGAGIARVIFQVGDAVDGHGGGTRAYHGDDDPQNLAPSWKRAASAGGEERPYQREGQGEDGVLELDHLEDDADAAFGHGWTCCAAER
jgi:hypothetical protein